MEPLRLQMQDAFFDFMYSTGEKLASKAARELEEGEDQTLAKASGSILRCGEDGDGAKVLSGSGEAKVNLIHGARANAAASLLEVETDTGKFTMGGVSIDGKA